MKMENRIKEQPRYDIYGLEPTRFEKDGRIVYRGIVYRDGDTHWVLNDDETASPLKWNGQWIGADINDAEVDSSLKIKPNAS